MGELFIANRRIGRFEHLLVIRTDANQSHALEDLLAAGRRKTHMRSRLAPIETSMDWRRSHASGCAT